MIENIIMSREKFQNFFYPFLTINILHYQQNKL